MTTSLQTTFGCWSTLFSESLDAFSCLCLKNSLEIEEEPLAQ